MKTYNFLKNEVRLIKLHKITCVLLRGCMTFFLLEFLIYMAAFIYVLRVIFNDRDAKPQYCFFFLILI